MKKISVFLSSLAILTLSACGNSTATGDAADSAAVDSVATEEAATDATASDDVVITITDAAKAVATDKPLVIDFNATWCGPCKMFAPVYHKVAADYTAKATFASVDVDECKALAEKYEISSIPCVVIIYPDGRKPASQLGNLPEDDFRAFLDANL